jgi:hypothetical protein
MSDAYVIVVLVVAAPPSPPSLTNLELYRGFAPFRSCNLASFPIGDGWKQERQKKRIFAILVSLLQKSFVFWVVVVWELLVGGGDLYLGEEMGNKEFNLCFNEPFSSIVSF